MTVKGGRLAGVIAAGVRFFAGARGGSVGGGGGGARSSRRGKASQGAARRRAPPRRNQVGARSLRFHLTKVDMLVVLIPFYETLRAPHLGYWLVEKY